MKRWRVWAALAFAVAIAVVAGGQSKKLSELVSTTTLSGADLLYALVDPSGVPADRRITVDNFRNVLFPVDVASFKTAGDGTSGSPWTGWDTAITWAGRRYVFREGHYAYVNSPNFLVENLELVGVGHVVIHHTGTGNAFVMDSALTVPHIRVENLKIQGNTNSTNGFFLRGVLRGHFNYCSVLGVPNAGLWSEACQFCTATQFRCARTVATWDGPQPAYGVVLTGRNDAAVDQTTNWNFDNLVVANCSQHAVWLKHAFFNQFNAGLTGACGGDGCRIETDGRENIFIACPYEENIGQDWNVSGKVSLIECTGLKATFDATQINASGGRFNTTTISSGSSGIFSNVQFSTLVNNAPQNVATPGCTTVAGYVPSVRETSFPKTRATGQFLAGGSTYTPDCHQHEFHLIIPLGNITIANPTVTPVDGQRLTFRIRQWTSVMTLGAVSWGTKYRGSGGVIPANTLTINKTDYYTFQYTITDDKWDLIEVKQDFGYILRKRPVFDSGSSFTLSA